MEAAFYAQVLAGGYYAGASAEVRQIFDGLLSGDDREVIALIGMHEDQHVEFLRSAISGAAGDTFADVFSNTATFMALAQAFEDAGVRAYQGQATNLMGNDDVLTAALQIHSVEARHASMIRRMRGSKGWITQAENTTAPAADAVYAGEDNLTQLGVDASSVTDVDRDGVTEAYDEPLTREQTLEMCSRRCFFVLRTDIAPAAPPQWLLLSPKQQNGHRQNPTCNSRRLGPRPATGGRCPRPGRNPEFR